MLTRTHIGLVLALFTAACSGGSSGSGASEPEATGGRPGGSSSGGSKATGGSSSPGTGGQAAGGQGAGGQTSGSGGQGAGGQGSGGQSGGQPDADVGGGGGSAADAAPEGDAPVVPPSDGGQPVPPSAPGQGPVAPGTIVYSQDFEQNMNGMSRSPNGLPEDRIQIIDDPLKQRGKIVQIKYLAGDNFRTSGGTEPRSWFSSAMGYTAMPNTTVTVAWGFMWENVSMGAHFAQIIRDGGPLWMFDVDAGGTVKADVHRGSGSTGAIMKLEPMKWYDFMVETDYRAGGAIKFFVNGKMVGQGTGAGGGNGRFDCGIYWGHNAKPTRTVYVSNVSISKK